MRLFLLALLLRSEEAVQAQAPLTRVRTSSQWRTPQLSPARPPGWTEPLFYQVSARLGLEANDNINVSQNDAQEDLILRPALEIRLSYTLTENSTLSLNVSPGYARYFAHPERDTFTVNTEGLTGLNFDLHVSRTRINLHSEFSLEQDAVNEGEVSSDSDYRRLINVTGFSVEPQYDQLQLLAGYDHITQLYIGSLSDESHAVESAYASVGWHVNDATVYRFSFAGAYVGTTRGEDDDGLTYSVSAVATKQISDYLRLQAEAGYGGVQFNGSRSEFDTKADETFFGNFSAQHRLNEWMSHTLRVGMDMVPSVQSNFREVIYTTHGTRWSVVRNVGLTTDLFYENSSSSLTAGGEDYARYGFGIGISFKLVRKLESNLAYRFVQKDSDRGGSDYRQHQLTLTLLRRF